MIPAAIDTGVLTTDVPTRWGTFAAGLAVAILKDDGAELVVLMIYVGDKQLNARVPREYVARGKAVDIVRVHKCWSCGSDALAGRPRTRCVLCHHRFTRTKDLASFAQEYRKLTSHGLSNAEAARFLSMSESQFEQRLFAARQGGYLAPRKREEVAS